jgi:hypothetical protein
MAARPARARHAGCRGRNAPCGASADHSLRAGLMKMIEQELRQHGVDPHRVTVDQLAPVHLRRRRCR